MNRKPSGVPRLSNLEWEIMKPLWEHGPMAARDLYAKVPGQYGLAYKTVKTMLSRLVKKGAVVYDQIGNSYLYRAAYTRGEMVRAATGTFVQHVFDGALTPFFAQFVRHVGKEELELLKRELARIEAEKSR